MIFGLLLLGSVAASSACDALPDVPEKVQVAWVSRLRATVGANAPMQVVRSVELQQLARDRTEAAPLLQALGLVGARADVDPADWKVSFFDVSRDALCRPMAGVPGDPRAGVPICDTPEQDRWHGTHARSWTGCGYLQDVAKGARTLDVFRLRWSAGVRDGFCLMPLARLLAGRG